MVMREKRSARSGKLILSLSEERLTSEKHAVTSARSAAAARSGFCLIRLMGGSFLMAICGKMKSKRQWVTRNKRFDAFNGSCGKAAANISHCSKSKTHDMIKKPCLSTREKQAFLIPIIPTQQILEYGSLFTIILRANHSQIC